MTTTVWRDLGQESRESNLTAVNNSEGQNEEEAGAKEETHPKMLQGRTDMIQWATGCGWMRRRSREE